MPLEAGLLEILACPACHAPLQDRTEPDDARADLHRPGLRPRLPGTRRHPRPPRRRGTPPRLTQATRPAAHRRTHDRCGQSVVPPPIGGSATCSTSHSSTPLKPSPAPTAAGCSAAPPKPAPAYAPPPGTPPRPGVADLHPDGRPRAVLVAGPGTAASRRRRPARRARRRSCPVTRLRPTGVAPAAGALRWALPGWAGPSTCC